MTTTTDSTTDVSPATRYPCPTGCEHAEDFAAHELTIQDGRPVLQHDVDFGTHTLGTVLHDLVTGEAEATIQFIDVEYPHGPKTPDDLRALAARIERAAEWLEGLQ